MITESERMYFRKITEEDFAELCQMLQDEEVMYAWEHAFCDREVWEWIQKRMRGYETSGYDYFLAMDKENKQVVGQIGLLREEVDQNFYLGLGYILKKEYWKKGYAKEGANAMLHYAFCCLNANEVIATIRPENTASRKVAEAVGMTQGGRFDKIYNGRIMPHLIYQIEKERYFRNNGGIVGK